MAVFPKPSGAKHGLNLIVKKAFIMGKSLPTKNRSGSALSTSGASIKSSGTAILPLGASENLSSDTTATTPNDTPATLTNVELQESRLRLGLVAGAFSDLLRMKGARVAFKNIQGEASGRAIKAVKIYIWFDGANVDVQHTEDGLDFNLVAVDGKDAK